MHANIVQQDFPEKKITGIRKSEMVRNETPVLEALDQTLAVVPGKQLGLHYLMMSRYVGHELTRHQLSSDEGIEAKSNTL